ncbi:MAG: flagellar hook-basal body complex protein FliE [Clostridiales bacterium]|jgi:flagellar hook-basal body complex protein FliE|nr:flagellar hook-basal body complex protein FliE [Clostridiales bacterium]
MILQPVPALLPGVSLQTSPAANPLNSGTSADSAGSTFEGIYQAAMNVLNETNRYQKEADRIQLDFAAGKTDNILSVMLAQEKAYNSLNFTVQATNKIIESYREIMRMQV